MGSRLMFLDCPAYLNRERAERCGLRVAGVGLSSRTMCLRGRLARWVFARDRHACPNPPSPAAMREALPGSTAGWPCPGMTQ
jgi:hypothetical protein